MNTKFAVIKKTAAITSLVSIVMVLGACSKPDETTSNKAASVTTEAVSDQFVGTRPAKFVGGKDVEGGMCAIDSINRQAVANLVAASGKLPFGVEGWSVTATKEKPVPSLIFAVLSGNNSTFYLQGKRKPRPDIAKGDILLDLAGFEVAGYLSNVPIGDYKLSIATGDADTLTVCRTNVAVRIGE